MSPRVLTISVVTLMVAVLLGGCIDRGRTVEDIRRSGGGASGPQPVEVVQGAYDELAAAGTARVRSTSTTQVGQIPIDVPGTGGADFRARAYDLSLDAPVLGSIEIIGIDDVVYARSDLATRTLPGNPAWVRIDPKSLEAEGLTGANYDNPFVRFAATTGDALPQLGLLKGARPADTRVVGPDTVEGEQTTHYSTVLDFEQARRFTADPRTAADVDRYTRTLRVATLPADVWVDAQGRLRQLRLVFSTVFNRPATVSTLSFSEPGAPVGPIVAPTDQVTDAGELAREFGN